MQTASRWRDVAKRADALAARHVKVGKLGCTSMDMARACCRSASSSMG